MPGSAECPDFFELPVDGQAARTRWVFWGANNQYVLGRFDGTTFTREAGPFPSHFGRNRYAAQTFSAIPPADGRRIQIAWMNGGTYPHMPFNQQMSLPVELSLHTFPEGVRLCTHPVKEVDGLHKAGKKSIAGALRATNKAWESPKSVAPKQSAVMSGIPKSGEDPLAGISGDLFDIQLSVAPGAARTITLNVRGTPILYDVRNKRLSLLGAAATVDLVEGNLILRVFVDRSSIEIFTADGRVNMACCFLPAEDDKTLSLASEGGDATIRSLDVWELNSAWPK
jgi:sucrose-6-phosphate hydrolase SacC (GH32 family)